MTTYIVVRDSDGWVLRLEKGNHPKERVGTRDGETVYSSKEITIPEDAGSKVYDAKTDTFSPKPRPTPPEVQAYRDAKASASPINQKLEDMADALFELYTGEKP